MSTLVGGPMEMFRSQLAILAGDWEKGKAGDGCVTIADMHLIT